MAGRKPSVRHGFGYYLSLSFAMHIIIMVAFSFIQIPTPQDIIPSEVIPVRIRTRPPLERPQVAELPAWLDPGEYVDYSVAEAVRYGDRSRLPASFRKAPAPPAVTGLEIGRRLQQPIIERDDFDAAEPPAPDEIEWAVENEVVSETPPPLPAVVEPTEEVDDFMPVEDLDQEDIQRRVVDRPVFPHARFQHLLPPRGVVAEFELSVSAYGDVTAVKVMRSTQNDQLDERLIEWIKTWQYAPGSTESSVEVLIEIPSE